MIPCSPLTRLVAGTFGLAVLATSASAQPYCDALLTAETMPKSYRKYAPVFSDTNSGWVIPADQLNQNYDLDDEARALIGDLAAALAARGTRLAIMVPPPRPFFVEAKNVAGFQAESGFDMAAARASFARHIADLNSLGVAAPDLSRLADGEFAADVYFRRDTHWTQRGAALSAFAMAEALGMTSGQSFADLDFSEVYEEKGSLAKMLGAACGDQPGPEQTMAASFAQEGGLDALLGDAAATGRIALIGTSFSDRYEEDAYRVADALAHATGAEVANHSMSGGGIVSPLETYIASGRLAAETPEVLIWEVPYTEPLANAAGLRQILGALTADGAGTALVDGKASDKWESFKTPFSATGHSALKFTLADATVEKLVVEFYDAAGTKTRVPMTRRAVVPGADRKGVWALSLGHLPSSEIVRFKLRLPRAKTPVAFVATLH